MTTFLEKVFRKEYFLIAIILFTGFKISSNSALIFCERNDIGTVDQQAATVPQANDDEKWFIIKSRNFVICCARDADLNAISSALEKMSLFASGVYDPNPVSSPAQKIAYRMDMILKRVEKSLDMYPENMALKIKIFDDRKKVLDVYYKTSGKRSDMGSFYLHAERTIYVSQQDISDLRMAHEMSRAVIDNYFAVTPPEKVREILAAYVSMHLEG